MENNTYLMIIETSDYLNRLEANQFNLFTQKLHNGIANALKKFKGKVLKANDNIYHVEFKSVSNCIFCALKIQSNFKYITPKFDRSIRQLKIGVTRYNNDPYLEQLAFRICEIIKNQIVITKAVKKDYETENNNSLINKEQIRTLSGTNVKFITHFMDYLENVWQDSTFSIAVLNTSLNYSSSHIYRELKSLTGKNPSNFVRDYRLKKALDFIKQRAGNITQISAQTGFKSNTYFTKCFKNRFGILPSTYIQQHT